MGIDVTVRGAGVTGLACAFEAARRGARVRVIDPAGVAAGASGGVVGALMPHAPERWTPAKAFQLDALLAARAFWPAVEAASGLPTGYARAGRLQPLGDEGAVALARERGEAARALWRGEARWRVEGAPTGWGPASPTGLVLRDTLSAHLHPRGACQALAGAVRALGGAVVREGADEGAVLHATGHAGLAALSEGRARPVGVPIKGQAALLAHDAAGAPQIFAGGVHVVPHLDGTVGVGSTTEREWDDPGATDGALDAVVERARAAVPALADAPVVARWAGLRPRARTRGPILGRWPGRTAFVANGGFKIGLGLAPGIAALMADLLLEECDRIPEGLRVEDAF
jgi:glycine oxidase